MSTSIRIPIVHSNEPATYKINPIQFPEKCIYCGEKMYEAVDVNINRKMKRSKNVGGKGANVSHYVDDTIYFKTTLQIPYCEKHKAENQKNNSLLGNASSAGILIGLAISVYAWITQSIGSALLWTVGLIILFTTIAYTFTKYILFRARKSLRDTFLVGGLGIGANTVTGSNEILNTNGWFESLEIKLVNSDIAREFSQLNGLEIFIPAKIEYSYKPPFVLFLILLAVFAILCASVAIFTAK